MNDLKDLNKTLDQEEKMLAYLQLQLENIEMEMIHKKNDLKERIKIKKSEITVTEHEIEKIESKKPHDACLMCQLCQDFQVCGKELMDDDECNEFKCIRLEHSCYFKGYSDCNYNPKKKMICLPGDCPLRSTKEYQVWRKI